MKNMKSSMKLLMPHTFLLVLLVSGIIISFVSITNIRKKTEALYDGPFTVKRTAGTFNEILEVMQMSAYRAISNDSQDMMDEAISEARNCAVMLQEQVAQLKQYGLGDMDALSRLEANLSELVQRQEYVLALADQNNRLEALEYMETGNIPVIKAAQKEMTLFIQSVEAKEREIMASLRQAQRNAIILLIDLGAIGVLFAVKDGAYFWRLYKGTRQTSEKNL